MVWIELSSGNNYDNYIYVDVFLMSPKAPPATYRNDMIAAIRHANINLFGRYGIEITDISFKNSSVTVLKIGYSNGTKIGNIGNRLRGISYYLLSRYKEIYSTYKVGTRLLKYCSYVDFTTDGSMLDQRMLDRLYLEFKEEFYQFLLERERKRKEK